MSEILCYPSHQSGRYGSAAPASQVTFIILKYYWDTLSIYKGLYLCN